MATISDEARGLTSETPHGPSSGRRFRHSLATAEATRLQTAGHHVVRHRIAMAPELSSRNARDLKRNASIVTVCIA